MCLCVRVFFFLRRIFTKVNSSPIGAGVSCKVWQVKRKMVEACQICGEPRVRRPNGTWDAFFSCGHEEVKKKFDFIFVTDSFVCAS